MERHGFVHDMLDVKVLILYIMARVAYPVDLQKIYELSYQKQSKGHFEPELDTAISVALHALQEPREMCCGGCQRFGDEDANGVGWCEEHDREAYCDEPPCGYFE